MSSDEEDDIPLAAIASSNKKRIKIKLSPNNSPKRDFNRNGDVDGDDNGEDGSATMTPASPVPSSNVPSKSVKKKSSSAKKKRRRDDSSSKPDHVTSSSSPAKKKTKKTTSNGTTSKGSKTKELKKLDKAERLQYAMQSFLWWNAKDPPEGCQWVTMEHAGVSFPEPYVPHRVKMKYDGKPVELKPDQEEA